MDTRPQGTGNLNTTASRRQKSALNSFSIRCQMSHKRAVRYSYNALARLWCCFMTKNLHPRIILSRQDANSRTQAPEALQQQRSTPPPPSTIAAVTHNDHPLPEPTRTQLAPTPRPQPTALLPSPLPSNYKAPPNPRANRSILDLPITVLPPRLQPQPGCLRTTQDGPSPTAVGVEGAVTAAGARSQEEG